MSEFPERQQFWMTPCKCTLSVKKGQNCGGVSEGIGVVTDCQPSSDDTRTTGLNYPRFCGKRWAPLGFKIQEHGYLCLLP